jgi:dolichol-phosphate mannosyltransferase
LVSTRKNSVSAIIACYKDGQAIPIMYERLVKVFAKLGLDYEIIFVNDCSPDDSSEVIASISGRDPNVIGIVHARNFGSQAAFRSGLEVATKEGCVLLDGDLQDPPELIEQFIDKWRAGADVVYGRRVAREMPGWLELFYKGFYKIFYWLSEFPIPQNAGDFSLLDGRVVREMLRCQERDSFLRGLRAYVGFRQEGVDYVRPERMFGVSTNNWVKNINWAKKAVFSFSRAPLHLLTAAGFLATLSSIFFSGVVLGIKFISPESAPRGITMVTLLIILFGSVNLLGLGLLGEYLGKIIEETKQRPPFIRASLIRKGAIAPWRNER